MKMTEEDFQALSTAVAPHITGKNERARWDALWASCFPTKKLYCYLNDSHIDTALRKIVGENHES